MNLVGHLRWGVLLKSSWLPVVKYITKRLHPMFHRVLNTPLKPYDLVKAIFLCFTTHKFVRFSSLLLNFKYCIIFTDYSQKICSLISRYRAKLRRRYFRFLDFWSISYKKNCNNPRTSDDFDMEFGAATKLYKRNKTSRR